MRLSDLYEMPMFTNKEMSVDDDEVELTTPFFITDARLTEKYNKLATKDNVEVYLQKDLSMACIGVREKRHDNQSGILLFGSLQLKSEPRLGFSISALEVAARKILQIDLVTVVKQATFMGLGTFLYSSIVQAGYTIISDNHQFIGGKELWQKIGRSHLGNEVVYVIDKGHVLAKDSVPIEYNGKNIPEDEIWSEDEQKKYVLFLYKKR